MVAGAKIWNSLPADLRLHVQLIETFGQKLLKSTCLSAMGAFEDFYFALYKFTHYYYYYYYTYYYHHHIIITSRFYTLI